MSRRAPDDDEFEPEALVPVTDADLRNAEAPQTAVVAEVSSIPTDPRRRILEIPLIGPDGKPFCSRSRLEPEVQARLEAEHRAKIELNLRERDALLSEVAKDGPARREVLELCARDPLFWFDFFVWTTDPREGDDSVPFLLYDEQRDSVRFWHEEFLPKAETKDGTRRMAWRESSPYVICCDIG